MYFPFKYSLKRAKKRKETKTYYFIKTLIIFFQDNDHTTHIYFILPYVVLSAIIIKDVVLLDVVIVIINFACMPPNFIQHVHLSPTVWSIKDPIIFVILPFVPVRRSEAVNFESSLPYHLLAFSSLSNQSLWACPMKTLSN